MKKPKKTLKDLGRVESLLSKQTERAAKLLARRKTGDAENPVTAGYYERIAAQQASALADLSEINHLIETLTRHALEADAAKSAKKAAKTQGKNNEAKSEAVVKPVTKPAASRKAAVTKPVAKPPVKRAPRRAPVKAPSN